MRRAAHRDTILAQAGSRWDERTGSVTMPVYQTATFRHPALGRSTGFDYSRSGNPTRQVLEDTLARLDGGARGFAFSSGLAALDCLLHLLAPGDRILVTEDLYGGTFRLLERVYRPLGIEAVYADTSRVEEVERCWDDRVKALLVETPTNPLLKVADIRALSALARARGALTIVDNTRLERQERNALAVAEFLSRHPRVGRVHYPGLPSHRGAATLRSQASGFGAVVSFEVDDPALVPALLARVRVFLFAESLGGVESLITFPSAQTHADLDEGVRERLGITDRLLRLSLGVEHVDDLVDDLDQALAA